MSIVETSGLTRTYAMGGALVAALHDVSFSIEEGEYAAITGPSGSGKSTLLNLLGCLDTPTAGHYRLAGHDVSRMSDNELSEIRRDRIGFVFQSFNLIPKLTVLENIEVPLFYAGISGSERRRRARRMAELVGLGDRTGHRPSELSGGEMQRVAIARALAIAPVVILADEPTGNLDTQTGREILKLLTTIHGQGATLIVVTHDEQIGAEAERVIHLIDGRLVSDTVSDRSQ